MAAYFRDRSAGDHIRLVWQAAGLCAASGLAAVLVGCSTIHASTAEATVMPRDIVEQVRLNAQLVVPPLAQANVVAPFKGTVQQVYRSVGSHVTRGEPILQVALPNATAAEQQAQAQLQQAQSAYQRARIEAQAQAARAKQRLAQAKQAAEQAPSIATGPEAQAGSAGGAANGSGQSQTSGSSSGTSSAASDVQQAQQGVAQAQQQMRQTLQPYQERLDYARRAYQMAQAAEQQGMMRAPIAGTIMALNAQPGQPADVNSNAPLATIINLDGMQVQAAIDPGDADRVHTGMSVNVYMAELPGKTFAGRVAQMTTRPDGTYVAIIPFQNIDRQVKPGYHAVVGVKTGRQVHSALAVPAQAVGLDHGRWIAYVRRGSNWVAVQVVPGVSDGLFTSIRSGLRQGDVVRMSRYG